MNTLEATISEMELMWEGPMLRMREGEFSSEDRDTVLSVLRNIPSPEGTTIDRRLVANLWSIPLFLAWQEERVLAKGADVNEYLTFRNAAYTLVGDILQCP